MLALSVVGAAAAVFYPEVTAFAVVTPVAVAAIQGWRDRAVPVMRISLVLYGIVGVVVLLRHNNLSYIFTIVLQMGQGSAPSTCRCRSSRIS